jgi:uncharacterized SAM-binding protein YcdF (DUF218 family)
MYDLVKLASLLVYPLGVFFLLGLVGAVLALLRRWLWSVCVFLVAFLWLWGWSMPVTSERLRAGLELSYPRFAATEAPEADAIVILGGAFSHDHSWPYPSAGGAVDRYWHGARLYHAGRAPRVVLSGAGNPTHPDNLTEAQAGALFLQDMGVPESALLLDNASRTTHDHVRYLSGMLEAKGLQRLLVVTSATHMRRAEAVFRAAGLEITPVTTGFTVRSSGPRGGIRRFVPSVGGLSGSTQAMHEYIGFWFYRLRGWV